MHFTIRTLRIVWNGNDITGLAYDDVTIDSEWMVVNGRAVVNAFTTKDWGTILDSEGVVTTPTTGYNKLGENRKFHGPFQRWMLLGNADDSLNNPDSVGKRIHFMRYS